VNSKIFNDRKHRAASLQQQSYIVVLQSNYIQRVFLQIQKDDLLELYTSAQEVKASHHKRALKSIRPTRKQKINKSALLHILCNAKYM